MATFSPASHFKKHHVGVGVGCIVMRKERLLMVRSRRGFWSPPGGKLEFGESLEECAIRETAEETGITVMNVEFVAITNDVFADTGRHYLTVWMRGDPDDSEARIIDPEEITGIGWYAPDDLPAPLHLDIENLLAARCWPASPTNLPFFP